MIMPDLVVGIDPGAGGGIAYFRDSRHTAVKMPKEVNQLRDYLNYIKSISARPLFFIEKQQQFHSDIEKPGKAFRTAKQLGNYERIKTLLEALNIPYIEVPPITWQTRLRVYQKGEEYTERKKRYIEVARTQCQTVRATANTADSLLIVQFGRFMLQYEIEWVESRIKAEHKKLF